MAAVKFRIGGPAKYTATHTFSASDRIDVSDFLVAL
jgi:hypothetical protein